MCIDNLDFFMEDFYRFDPTTTTTTSFSPNETVVRLESCFPDHVGNFSTTSPASEFLSQVGNLSQFDHQAAGDDHDHTQVTGSDMYNLIKAQILNHPRYPHLVSAHIDCQKVGAPPEMVSLLEEIERGNYPISNCCEIGADPELDEFMESYCEVLHRYKQELSKPFDEATTFLRSIESQLRNLCKGTLTEILDCGSADEPAGTSEEELSCGEVEASESLESPSGRLDDPNLKGILLRKYSGYLGNLRKEFLKKRKKGKLPKDARIMLLDWWNNHYRWPYPTEEEKAKLSEITGLDQKQINNWFINQRKRHWKPSAGMRFALMDVISGNMEGPTYCDIGGDDLRHES